MARRLFIPNPGFAKEYARSDTPDEMLQDLADRTAARARQDAPRRSGNYRDSIKGIVGPDETGVHVGRVLATDFKAHWIEAGTGQPLPTPAFHTLARAAEAVVGKVGR